MANADGRVVIDCDLNDAGFSKGIANTKKKVGGLSSALKKLGKTIAATFAVKAIVDFGKECIEVGSNVSEVQNVVDTAFGDMSYKVEEFSKAAITQFGMSSLAAKKTASTYMAMAKSMGLSEESASNMSISLAAMTADVASFYNISQELADVKLKSVFTGETESLKDLGVVMTQTNLKAFALAQGITKDISEMSQAEQVALRYNYVMETLSLAQGDFAKTSKSWANQTRVLSMQWQELMSILGQVLITVLTPLLQRLNEIVGALIKLATYAKDAVYSLLGIQETVSEGMGKGIQSAVNAQDDFTDSIEESEKAQKKLLAGFDEINKLGGESKSQGSDAGAGSDIYIAPLELQATEEQEEPAIIRWIQTIREAAEPALEAIGKLWEKLKEVGAFAADSLTNIFQYIVETGIENVWAAIQNVWSLIVELGSPIYGWFSEDYLQFIKTFAESFVNVITDIFNSVKEAWNKWGKPIFESLKTAFVGTFETFANIWETIISPIWDKIFGTVSTLWNNHLKPLLKNFLDFVGKLANGVLEIYNKFILPVVNWIVREFGPAIAGGIGYVVEIFGGLFGGVVDAASYVIDALKGVVDFVVGVFTGDWLRAWNGLSDIFKGVINGMLALVESFVNFFIHAINKVIDAANTLSFTAPDWLGGKTYGLNFRKISELKLPRLATGAVVPPNREFMAVLGDNKSETEVVSPLSTMKQAMLEALREAGGSGETTLVLEGDLAILARVLRPYILKEDKRVGVTLVTK